MIEQFKYNGFNIIFDNEFDHYELYKIGQKKHNQHFRNSRPDGILHNGTYYQDLFGGQKEYEDNIIDLIYNYIDAIYEGTAIPIYGGDPLKERKENNEKR